MTNIRIRVFVDEKVTYTSMVEEALKQLREDYIVATDGKVNLMWAYETRQFPNFKWEEYLANSYGIDRQWVTADTAAVRKKHGDAYSCVMYVIDNENWTDKGSSIYGWNLGIFYNGYQVQLIRGVPKVRSLYLTFSMELFHAMDNFIFKDLGVNMSKFFNVPDFDEDIVHGRHSDWEVFLYRPAIRRMTYLLIKTFKGRENMLVIQLMKTLLALMRQYMMLLLKRSQPTPVHGEDVK